MSETLAPCKAYIHEFSVPVEYALERHSSTTHHYLRLSNWTNVPAMPDRIRVTTLRCAYCPAIVRVEVP